MTDTSTAAPAVDLEQRVAQFVRLRDMVKEIEKKHEAELAPYREARQMLEGLFSQVLDGNNTKSMRTEAGTITATERSSATVEDMDAFRTFVVNMGEWDLADVKANAPAVRAWSEANAQLPPGVKFSLMRTISVRRASS